MTIATQLVLRALLADPTSEVYGSEIGEAAGLMSGPSTRSWRAWRPRGGWHRTGRTSTLEQSRGQPVATTA